jgi:GNAT superfamily N-acetyltransferase
MAAYAAATTPAKKSTFPNNETFFYIQLIGAATAHRGKGLAPALIRKLQEQARSEGKAVYLEASNEGARRVYQKLGFEEVGDVISVGKGECDAQGERAEGGKAVGVPMWPMVWWPTGGHGAAQE